MARDTGGFVDVSGLEDLRERAAYLGKYAWADALQEAMNELAEAAVDHLADDWDKAIEGGPVAFAKVSRKRSSAVRAVTRKGATKGVAEASVAVQPRQSAFLKYALGEADEREPGDVGAAESYNFIPVADALRKRLGIRVTKQGNLPRNALARLSQSVRASKVGPNPQTKDSRGRFMKTARGDAGAAGTFFGTVRRKGKKPLTAFWSRDGNKREGKLRALAIAVERSKYKPTLVPTWNASMEATEADVTHIIRPLLERLIDQRFARQAAGRSRKAENARAKRSTKAAQERMRKEAEALASGKTPEVLAAERKAKKAAYDRARAEARRQAKGRT